MTLAKVTNQRERDKFKEVGSATTVQVTIYDSSGDQIDLAKETGGNLDSIKSNTDHIPSPTGINGAPATVGTTAVEMTFTGTTKVISLKAASTNTGLIWFGPAAVTSTGANAYGELTADSSVEIEFNDVSTAIYCVSDTAAQTCYKVALT